MNTKYGIQNIDQFSRRCYYVGLGIGLIAFTCIVIISAFDIEITKIVPPCYFFQATGYYCPGCGGTRSVRSLLNGNIIASIYYHAFVAYIVAGYTIYEISHTLSILTKNKIKGIYFSPIYFYIGIAIIIVQWLMKNFMHYYNGFCL